MSGRKPSPMQDQIRALHREDCTLSKCEIAKRLGCSDKYVGICFARLNIRVGVPALSGDDLSLKSVLPSGWRETIAKPVPFRPRQTQSGHCHKMTYADGVLHRCNAPTEGHTYCASCNHGLVAMFDPPVKQPPAASAA